MGIASPDQGVVYRINGSVTTSGADLLIDYATAPSPKFVIGAYSDNGSLLENNLVTLAAGNVNGPVFGALSNWSSITSDVNKSGNPVTVNNSAVTDINMPSLSARTNQNTVYISSGVAVSGDIYAGHASIWGQSGDAVAGNVISIDTTSAYAPALARTYVDDSVITSTDNMVVIGNNASVTGNIYSGYANLTVLSGDTMNGNTTANASGANAYAQGLSNIRAIDSAITATDNQVVIGNNSFAKGNIYGAYANLTGLSGNAVSGNASGSKDAFTNSSSDSILWISAITASNNTVSTGSDTLVEGSIYGGYASLLSQTGNATGGNATSTNGTPFSFATSSISIDYSTITSSNNMVNIDRGTTLVGNLYGGYASLKAAAGTATAGFNNGSPSSATSSVNVSNTYIQANNNQVVLNGTVQGGHIYGGNVAFDIVQGNATGGVTNDNSVILANTQVQAINNTVSLGDTAYISEKTGSLYGGYLHYNAGFSPDSYDLFTGNTLNYYSLSPVTLQNLGNFENINFAINPAYANKTTSLITVQDVVLGATSSNISDGSTTPSKIKIVGIHTGNILHANDKFVLLKATNSMSGNATGSSTTGISQLQQGISLLYDVRTDINVTNMEVTATILGCQTSTLESCPYGAATVNPQLKALSESYLAGAALVNRGADLIADETIKAINVQNNQREYAPFAILSGQHNRHESGSHIKSNDFLLTGGLSYQQNGLTTGIFAEAGWGNYDTYNSFVNAANVKGNGNDRYYGLGLLGRYDFANRFYTEVSLRFGQHRNKFNTNNLRNITTGEAARYNLKNSYLSAHMGGGYILSLNEKSHVDLSAKYLWTRLGGKDATIAGDNFHFDSINSRRLRVNGEWNHVYNKTLTLKAGLGYEHEFDSKAHATTSGIFDIDVVTLKGNTGIISLGANIKPESSQRLSVDFKLNAYTGKREGANATVRMNYAF